MKTFQFASNSLVDIFQSLQSIVQNAASYELSEELQEARDTYANMLRYMVQGVDDPNSIPIYQGLIQQAYTLADRAHRKTRLGKQTSDKYSLTLKYLNQNESLRSLLATLEATDERMAELQREPNKRDSIQEHEINNLRNLRETALTQLFEMTWTSDLWRKSDYETATTLLGSDTIPDNDKALFVSAATLAQMEMFDERKLMLLFDAYLLPSVQVSQRALVGILLILRMYESRIHYFTNIESRFSLYCDDPNFVSDCYRIFMQLQYSKLTDSISTKMRDDIIPSLLKSGKFRQTQFGLQEIDDYMTQNGENPEWIHNKDDEKAQEKLHEMAELQMEGADVYMSTFTHMKGHAFFHSISHWFMPFDRQQPQLAEAMKNIAEKGSTFMTQLLRITPFCHSDKYSFAFMLSSMGNTMQDMLMANMNNELSEEEFNEHLKEMKAQPPKPADVSRLYIYDLYRFFQVYPYHPQFPNPFKADEPAFTPTATSLFSPLLEKHEQIATLADFFMRKGIYKEAIELFELTLPKLKENEELSEVWQKIGFCEQKQGNHEDAFKSYKMAYDLNSQSLWTLKHLAHAALLAGWPGEAEDYYNMLLENDPDNLHYLKRKAVCLMKENIFNQAIPVLYKVLYFEEDSAENKNNLAWCHLQEGNTEKAHEIYEDVLMHHAELPSAHFNMACCYLVEHDMRQAYNYFSKAWKMQENTKGGQEKFVNDFRGAFAELQPVTHLNDRQGETLLDAIRMGI